MRLWHKDLISVLPREQLVAQWRELSAIAGNILNKGTPNHILVNKVMEYPLDHFINYAFYIRKEMTDRGYKTMDRVFNKIISLKEDYKLVKREDLFPNWHNNIYFLICYYNLYEKYLCGGIKEEDFNKIDKVYPSELILKNLNNYNVIYTKDDFVQSIDLKGYNKKEIELYMLNDPDCYLNKIIKR